MKSDSRTKTQRITDASRHSEGLGIFNVIYRNVNQSKHSEHCTEMLTITAVAVPSITTITIRKPMAIS